MWMCSVLKRSTRSPVLSISHPPLVMMMVAMVLVLVLLLSFVGSPLLNFLCMSCTYVFDFAYTIPSYRHIIVWRALQLLEQKCSILCDSFEWVHVRKPR